MIINILTITDNIVQIKGADYFYKEEDAYEVVRINGEKHEIVGSFGIDKVIGVFVDEVEK